MADLLTIEPENGAEDVIKTLERALELAFEGKISSVAIAIVKRDGVGAALWSTAPMTLAMVGAIHRLQHMFDVHVDSRGTGPTSA